MAMGKRKACLSPVFTLLSFVPLFVSNETLLFSFPQCNLYSFYEQKMCWKHCSLFVTKDSLLSSQWIVSILRNIEHIVTRVHYSVQFYNLNALVLWANKRCAAKDIYCPQWMWFCVHFFVCKIPCLCGIFFKTCNSFQSHSVPLTHIPVPGGI